MQDVVIPVRHYINGNAFSSGIGFDGSSVRGFKSIEESDMILIPEPETLIPLPWAIEDAQKSAIVIGELASSTKELRRKTLRAFIMVTVKPGTS